MTLPYRLTQSQDWKGLVLVFPCHFIVSRLPNFLTLVPLWYNEKASYKSKAQKTSLDTRSTCNPFHDHSPALWNAS